MWIAVVQAREVSAQSHGDGCEEGSGIETVLHEDPRGLDELMKEA